MAVALSSRLPALVGVDHPIVLMLGADAAQLGTAFLCCPESGIHPAWKQAILQARDDSTRLTRVFSGGHARGLVNELEAVRHH